MFECDDVTCVYFIMYMCILPRFEKKCNECVYVCRTGGGADRRGTEIVMIFWDEGGDCNFTNKNYIQSKRKRVSTIYFRNRLFVPQPSQSRPEILGQNYC